MTATNRNRVESLRQPFPPAGNLLVPSLTVPIADGKLVLGTWQQIFHLECDVRGRRRTVLVTGVGD